MQPVLKIVLDRNGQYNGIYADKSVPEEELPQIEIIDVLKAGVNPHVDIALKEIFKEGKYKKLKHIGG